jgi:hypothetical protein
MRKLAALACLACTAWPAFAQTVDLTKIERTLRKEPAYQSKKPKYCLLVFGPEAKTRVWLVLDGKVLYVDRAGAGDLTGDDSQVADSGVRFPKFAIGVITDADGKTEYSGLTLSFPKKTEDASITLFAPLGKEEYELYAGIANGEELRFADCAQDAPIIHFNGPLTMRVGTGQKPLTRGAKLGEIHAFLGSVGLGKGTFARTSAPVKAGEEKPPTRELPSPAARIEFPHRDGKQKPIVVQAVLKAE